MDYEKLHKDTINKLQQMVSCGKITVEVAREICADFVTGNEDEIIRKELIKFVKSRLAGFPECDRFIAFLEEQGKHASFRNKIQVGDKVTRNENGVLVNLSQLNRVAKPADKVEPSFDEAQGTPIIKQEEHKPTDKVEPKFHEGDSIQFNGFGHNTYKIKEVCGLSHYINTNENRMDMSYTDANFEIIKDSDKIKLSPVWSEEDENLFNKCLIDIQMVDSDDTLKIWLKSLKDRIQLKQNKL